MQITCAFSFKVELKSEIQFFKTAFWLYVANLEPNLIKKITKSSKEKENILTSKMKKSAKIKMYKVSEGTL